MQNKYRSVVWSDIELAEELNMFQQFYLMHTILMINSLRAVTCRLIQPQYVSISAISRRRSCAGQLSIIFAKYIYIFQSSLEQQKVLTLWKEAIVVLVDKVTSPKSLLSPRGPCLPCNENL